MGKRFSRPLSLRSGRKFGGRSPQGSNPLGWDPVANSEEGTESSLSWAKGGEDAATDLPSPNASMTWAHQGSDLPSPKISVILPPEILDKILENVPTDRGGRRTLMACALVAAWWTGPSQRHLFSSVEIHERNYKRWMNGVVLSESKDHLLEHVRSLQYACFVGYRMRHPPGGSRNYLSALRNLHSLTLCHTRVEHISETEFRACFSTFRETLTSLSLDNVTTSLSTFVTLVDYFPNITTLRLDSFELEPSSEPVPPLSRPLRGKLHLRDVDDHHSRSLDQFVNLDLEYEELVINFSPRYHIGVIEKALQISTSTVKYLRLTGEIQRK